MNNKRFITGWMKIFLYTRIALFVACKYAGQPDLFRWSLRAYMQFLSRALRLLLIFRHHKAVKTSLGYKLDLYLPAYPSRAFYWALENKLLRTPPSPVTVVFSMTKACPYRCSHCYQRKDENLELEESLMLGTARQLQEMGVAMFDIEGGEPFTRFPRLLKLMEALDDRSELWINTTGAGMKPAMLEQLKRVGLAGLMVSIHSPDPEVHDRLTGVPGSFQRACEAIRQCRSLGLITAVNSVLSEQEIRTGGLDHLMLLALELDADFVQLIHPKPAGMWLGRHESMQTDAGILDFIRLEHKRFHNSRHERFPALAAQVFEESENMLGCTSGGVDRFYVNASGEIQPCEFLNISFGNVSEEPLDVVFNRMRAAFSVPCCDWLCCSLGGMIAETIREHGVSVTPVPWAITQDLVKKWNRGRETPLYQRLGIYS